MAAYVAITVLFGLPKGFACHGFDKNCECLRLSDLKMGFVNEKALLAIKHQNIAGIVHAKSFDDSIRAMGSFAVDNRVVSVCLKGIPHNRRALIDKIAAQADSDFFVEHTEKKEEYS